MKTIGKTVRFEPGIYRLIEDGANKNHIKVINWIYRLVLESLENDYGTEVIQKAKNG